MSTAATATTATVGRRPESLRLGVRLPGEASPAEEAKNEQHNDNDDDDPKNRHVIPSLGGFRHYSPSACLCNVRGHTRASRDSLLAEAYGNPATAIIGDGDRRFSRGHSVSSTARRLRKPWLTSSL